MGEEAVGGGEPSPAAHTDHSSLIARGVLLALVFAAAAAGSVVGAILTRALWPRFDWTAFGAIATALGGVATFAAVVVALWPIWQSRRREKAQARSLRLRVFAQLVVIRKAVGRRTNEGHREDAGSFASETDAPTSILSTLLPELVLFEDEESVLVHAVHVNLVLARAAGGLPLEQAVDLLALTEQALTAVDARLALQGRASLPWERRGASTASGAAHAAP